MELKDFISNTLIQIIDGIKLAQTHADKNQAEVASVVSLGQKLHNIKFNVAVRTTDGSESEGGAGIFVGPIAIGGRVGTAESSEATSRIEFDVPMYYPENKRKDVA